MIKELTGKHVLILILSFFGIIFVVNGYMIYVSQSSWTGLETKDAYRKGVKYNQQLSEFRAQNNRGWKMEITNTDLPENGMRFTAVPHDEKGELLSLLEVNIELMRPTHEGMDRTIALKETEVGVYTGETAALPKGKWYLIVTAGQKNEILYRSKNELYLR